MSNPENDVTGFRVGHSHGDIIYHHIKGRNKNEDPRWAVCQSKEEAEIMVEILNSYLKNHSWTEEDFKALGLRW